MPKNFVFWHPRPEPKKLTDARKSKLSPPAQPGEILLSL